MRCLLPVVLLLALGVSIGGPALDPGFEPPAPHYDGDDDDAGHVGKIFAYWVDTAVTETLTFVPSAPRRHRAPNDVPGRSRSLLEPLGSRAPPA